MRDRSKLTLASLIVMMLPYQLGFSLSVLLVTAIMATAIVAVKDIWGPTKVSP